MSCFNNRPHVVLREVNLRYVPAKRFGNSAGLPARVNRVKAEVM